MESLNQLHETAKEIQALKREINEILFREEIMWKQRLRALWIKSGDRNTKFFHATANQRHRKNRIERLRDGDGRWKDEPEDVENIILNYFSTIFSTDHPEDFEASLSAVNSRVSDEMNDFLLREFKEDEVWSALKQMHPTKSPGLDGMSPIFFQKYWDVVGSSVINCVIQTLKTGIMPGGLNNTYICLIPKVKFPQEITSLDLSAYAMWFIKLYQKCWLTG